VLVGGTVQADQAVALYPERSVSLRLCLFSIDWTRTSSACQKDDY